MNLKELEQFCNDGLDLGCAGVGVPGGCYFCQKEFDPALYDRRRAAEQAKQLAEVPKVDPYASHREYLVRKKIESGTPPPPPQEPPQIRILDLATLADLMCKHTPHGAGDDYE
jgi:hypothetical protein